MTDHGALDDAEALFYDWHNSHRLRAQRDDVGYWLRTVREARKVLVLGAGTGRVVVPLALDGCSVTAVDLSASRLRRIPATPRLELVHADMRELPLDGGFDVVIVPYSTLQLLPGAEDRDRALREAARVLIPGGLLHVDVSANFDTRLSADWHAVLSAMCREVGETVVEWERSRSEDNHVVIDKSFRTEDGRVLVDVREHWVFWRALDLGAALDQAGFDLTAVDRGYGAGSSEHRHIYRARLR